MVPIIVLVAKTSLLANEPSSNLFHICNSVDIGTANHRKKKHAVCTLKYLYTARFKRMINSPFVSWSLLEVSAQKLNQEADITTKTIVNIAEYSHPYKQ